MPWVTAKQERSRRRQVTTRRRRMEIDADQRLRSLKVRVRVVEEHDPDVARVVLVNHPGADVDVILPCQPRSRRDAAIGALGNRNCLLARKWGFNRLQLAPRALGRGVGYSPGQS